MQKEQLLPDEVAKGKVARIQYAADNHKGEIRFEVPHQIVVDKAGRQRLIAAEFAAGKSFFDLPADIRARAGKAILERESQTLFADKDTISFDPDRHAGNYRFDVKPGSAGQDEIIVRPIDFGQLVSITRDQRAEIVKLFSLAQILRQSGSTEWAVQEMIRVSKLDPALAPKIKKAIGKYFPDLKAREVTAYYATLAVLDEVGHGRDIAYFDEKSLPPESQVQGPKQKLASLVQVVANEMLGRMTLLAREKVAIAYKHTRQTEGGLWKGLKDRFWNSRTPSSTTVVPAPAPAPEHRQALVEQLNEKFRAAGACL